MECMVKQIVEESHSMLKHALSQGLKVPVGIAENLYNLRNKFLKAEEAEFALETTEIKELAAIHQSLARTIEPATPNTINLLYSDAANNKIFRFLGPVPLVRQLSFVSIFLLIVLLLLASSQHVNSASIIRGFFESSGTELLITQAFLLCCAGLGAAFSGLFTANRYIAQGTYDPKYDSSYWSSLILGFMAGTIIVELLPTELFKADGSELASFGKPTFALLGGFAANMLYRLLKRLVDTFEHFIRGERGAIEEANARAEQALRSEKETEMQSNQVMELVKLQGELKAETDLDSAKQKINAVVEKAMARA